MNTWRQILAWETPTATKRNVVKSLSELGYEVKSYTNKSTYKLYVAKLARNGLPLMVNDAFLPQVSEVVKALIPDATVEMKEWGVYDDETPAENERNRMTRVIVTLPLVRAEVVLDREALLEELQAAGLNPSSAGIRPNKGGYIITYYGGLSRANKQRVLDILLKYSPLARIRPGSNGNYVSRFTYFDIPAKIQ